MSGYAMARALARKAGRNRITVGGEDVTDFREARTPFPGYPLTEPFGYGATTLTFPQVHAGYERAGVGDLYWAKAGARVVFSRIFDDGHEVIDYVGRVDSINPTGRALQLSVGGDFSGPASMLGEQNQLYRQSLDVGRYASLAAERVGLAFSPWFGPVTGIKITHAGGQSLLSWAQYVCAMSQDDNGVQRSIMPTAWGGPTWEFREKDYTTVHATAFNDDEDVTLLVVDDSAERPNVIYGTGISPDGVRWSNGKWPHVFAGPAPDYPIVGGSSFGVGTTDADTRNGDGIEVLYYALRELGYLPYEVPFTGVYTTEIGAAVQRFRKDVGLPASTSMTQNAWNRLFDLDATGRTINGAKVFPLAYDPRVEPYLYSPKGLIVGRNPAYDPTIPRVERTIDFGPGISKGNARRYAQGIIARSLSMKNWTGTLRFNLGMWQGHVVDRTAVTEADILAPRDARPGMNVWVPDFDGGTLFHISGVQVDENGVATATVDTQARDLVEVKEIIARNAESRRDIRREWNIENRTTKRSHAMVARDENFGKLDRDIAMRGGRWNCFQIIMGQHGQVNRTRVRTVRAKAGFVILVAQIDLSEARLDRWIGNPLAAVPDGGTPWWEKDDNADRFESKKFLYTAGTHDQPCGFAPHKHTDDKGNVTSWSPTGKWNDDANWPYINEAGTAVLDWVAIYPDRDTVLKRGQLFWAQEDDVV